jgi:signal transduction histidine kinase
VPVELDVAEGLPPLPPSVETAAYRIAQEALTNVARHAGASRACLALTTIGDALRVEVSDDGHGFSSARTQGVGLASMQHRAETLGGSLAVTSSESGTIVVATLPMETRT